MRPWVADLVPGLVAAAAVLTVGTWARLSPFPLLNDDATYLGRACALANLGFLEWGPAYAALYCGLRHLFADPFAAFWVKQAIVPLLAGALIYGLGLRLGIEAMVASLAALWCVLALLSVNGTVELAFVLGLAACLCAASGTAIGWTGFFVVMGVAFLVRTEYLVAVAAALLLLFLRRHAITVGARRTAWAMGGIVLAGCLALGSARAPGERGRSWFAFGQQFAVNYGEAHVVSGDPLVDWRRITARSFPSSGSIADAVSENPRMFIWHLRHNVVVRVPRALARLLLPVPSFAALPPPWTELLGAAVVIVVVIAAVRGALTSGRLVDPRLTGLLALAAIPSVSLVFRPQSRHLLPVLPLAVVLVVEGLLRPAQGRVGWLRTSLRLVLGVLLLAGLARPWMLWSRGGAPSDTAVAEGIRSLRGEAQVRPVRLLASWYADRVCALVGPRCEPVSFAERTESGSLSEFIDAQRVDTVLVGPDWASRADVQADTRVRDLAARPERFGCVAEPARAEGFRFLRCPQPLNLGRP